MRLKHRLWGSILGALFAFGVWWFCLGPWPDPLLASIPWRPDAILILGGGDSARVRQGRNLSDLYPDIPLVVTGDGGDIVSGLLLAGVAEKRILHERAAASTMDNAVLTDVILDELKAKRVAIVTNWFHVPRALAVFEKVQPERDFAPIFEKKAEPLPEWDRNSQRRERFASIWYLLRFGVWSW